MSQKIRFTKIELKAQRDRLKMLNQYLPSLKLKKLMLQAEVLKIQDEIRETSESLAKEKKGLALWSKVFAGDNLADLLENITVEEVVVGRDNIAGAEIPVFQDVVFKQSEGFLYNRPYWVDDASHFLQIVIRIKEKLQVTREVLSVLEKELREVSIRVNLFEKVLIPRTEKLIHQIQIFLSDIELQAVGQSKVAKSKLLKKRMINEDVVA